MNWDNPSIHMENESISGRRVMPLSVRKQSFIQGAMILLAAGLLNRILGFIPRVALPRMIGAEGVGLIQLVYPFTIVMLTLIAGGIPLAVAKLVAEADSKHDLRAVS